MLKKLFAINNPITWISAAALILVVSPEARSGTRKMLVKGTGAVLSLSDSVKTLALGSREQFGKFLEEAKVEKEQMNIPEMIEMGGERMKQSLQGAMEKSKQTFEKTKGSMENIFEKTADVTNLDTSAYNVVNDHLVKAKLDEIEQQFH
ncbi:hypothetical protein [Bacillus sp. FJAT-52991]|uniref:YtxH domain-containing protein n=1 Tax=Bacillus kandeliae TaxID=3129297 RepID=A0ABZ2N743_9BACI